VAVIAQPIGSAKNSNLLEQRSCLPSIERGSWRSRSKEKRIRGSRCLRCSLSAGINRAAPKAFGVGSGFESRPTQFISEQISPCRDCGFCFPS